jgi:hypothetical protein
VSTPQDKSHQTRPNKKERKKADRSTRRPTADQVLLTGRQVEMVYGLPYRSLYDLHVRDVLPAVVFDGSRRLWFRRSDIETLIESSRTVAS